MGQENQLWYSLRRYYIDEFFLRQARNFHSEEMILDIGGNKTRKRGRFNIDCYSNNVTYTNIDQQKGVDVLADAGALPFQDSSFDIVICAEILEHIYDPSKVISEALRILRPNGRLLITVPFLFRIHPDPCDYGRYTNFYWQRLLVDIGFAKLSIKQQGEFWSVLLDMLREYFYQKSKNARWQRGVIYLVGKINQLLFAWVVKRESGVSRSAEAFFSAYTTGFEIVAYKTSKPVS